MNVSLVRLWHVDYYEFMNIISGNYKRRKLLYPKQRQFRPTKSIVREAVFSMIGHNIQGASFLDLCSGTGAMGLEAESRGASQVVCVDRDTHYLNQNVEQLNASALVVRSDAIRYLKTVDQSFDYIYFDPVWSDYMIYEQTILLIFNCQILTDTGWLLIEHDHTLKDRFLTHQYVLRQTHYGNSFLTIVSKPGLR